MIRSALCALVVLTGTAAASPYPNAPTPPPIAPAGVDPVIYMEECIVAAAGAYKLPPALIVLIIRVEGGRLGRVSPNASGAPPDVGPMQVNAMWLTKLAARWKTTREQAFLYLRDNFCANVEAGAWILRDAIDSAPEDFWRGVTRYHSRTSHFAARYQHLLRTQALAMVREAQQARRQATAGRSE